MSLHAPAVASAHVDTFARDGLPAEGALPQFSYHGLDVEIPDQLNAATFLFARAMANGYGGRPMLRASTQTLTYQEADTASNGIAAYLKGTLGLQPGNRVLLRGGNSIDLALAWLGAVKAGLIAVATMPLLRAKELHEVVNKGQIAHAMCADALLDELVKTKAESVVLQHVVPLSAFTVPSAQISDANVLCKTSADDIAMMAFTSGTTGTPKAALHTHRDLIAACAAWPVHVLRMTADDIVMGSPPLAFTFGLGGLLLFPMWSGASVYFHDKPYTPETMIDAVHAQGATIAVTAPTFYRQMLPFAHARGIARLRACVSAGEALPDSTRTLWREATGIEMLDGIGATELFHIFISSANADVRPGAIGKVVPGYEAKVVDDAGNELPRGAVGKLAVRGCTGCKYLDDARQAKYVKDGWNYPGDAFSQDEAGYFYYQARTDDMIITSGYNVGAPEVEEALLAHASVAECGVIGKPDADRGMIVKAFIVVRPTATADAALVKTLQDHVKAKLAPYKYPREIEFVAMLPRTETGKLQRFRLRADEKGSQ